MFYWGCSGSNYFWWPANKPIRKVKLILADYVKLILALITRCRINRGSPWGWNLLISGFNFSGNTWNSVWCTRTERLHPFWFWSQGCFCRSCVSSNLSRFLLACSWISSKDTVTFIPKENFLNLLSFFFHFKATFFSLAWHLKSHLEVFLTSQVEKK